jgi:outer membrane protein OmpA-like peptidoglycan-associated protein
MCNGTNPNCNCSKCQEYAPSRTLELMIPNELPRLNRPVLRVPRQVQTSMGSAPEYHARTYVSGQSATPSTNEVRQRVLNFVNAYVPSKTGDGRFEVIAQDYEGIGTTCGFLVHAALWVAGCTNKEIVNRNVPKKVRPGEKREFTYINGANISRIYRGGKFPFKDTYHTGFPRSERPNPGDIVFISNGAQISKTGKTTYSSEHVFIFLREFTENGKTYWESADAGQKCEGRECAKFITREFRINGSRATLGSSPRFIYGWLPLEKLEFGPARAFPAMTVSAAAVPIVRAHPSRPATALGTTSIPPQKTDTDITLEHFQYKKATLENNHRVRISALVRRIQASYKTDKPIRLIRIVGHTDSVGSDQYNFDLGLQRAEHVQAGIIQEMKRTSPSLISQIQFQILSRGEREQISQDPTKNRRVKVTLVYRPSSSAPIIPSHSSSTPPVTSSRLEFELNRRISLVQSENIDNLSRTKFYLQYWRRHPEILWSLFAHLISRNAGYQISDTFRYAAIAEKIRSGSLAVSSIFSPISGISILPLSELLQLDFVEVRRFIEVGNFLIFSDVSKHLVAYEFAKDLHLAGTYTPIVFRLLSKLGVDKFIIEEWINFFKIASGNNFYKSIPSPERSFPEIERMTHALIINEQSYLEEALINPTSTAFKYINPVSKSSIIGALYSRDVGSVILPWSQVITPGDAEIFFVHRVKNFIELRSRINTGRNQFWAAFLSTGFDSGGFKRWANSGASHSGSRMDYDPQNFDSFTGGVNIHSPILARGSFSPPRPSKDFDSVLPFANWLKAPPANWSSDPVKLGLALSLLGPVPKALRFGDVFKSSLTPPVKGRELVEFTVSTKFGI